MPSHTKTDIITLNFVKGISEDTEETSSVLTGRLNSKDTLRAINPHRILFGMPEDLSALGTTSKLI